LAIIEMEETGGFESQAARVRCAFMPVALTVRSEKRLIFTQPKKFLSDPQSRLSLLARPGPAQ
jgi:hypothetical protein